MKYLVMECHLSYAIVVDNKGRFLKVANMNYEPGQTLDTVFPQADMNKSGTARRNKMIQIAFTAACLCMLMIGSLQFVILPYGTVRMQINPDVLLYVNRLHYVIKAEGLNDDGRNLLDGYHTYGKSLLHLSSELADRATEMGYMKEEGTITFTVESSHTKWKTAIEEQIMSDMDAHLNHKVNIHFSEEADDTASDITPTGEAEIAVETLTESTSSTPSVTDDATNDDFKDISDTDSDGNDDSDDEADDNDDDDENSSDADAHGNDDDDDNDSDIDTHDNDDDDDNDSDIDAHDNDDDDDINEVDDDVDDDHSDSDVHNDDDDDDDSSDADGDDDDDDISEVDDDVDDDHSDSAVHNDDDDDVDSGDADDDDDDDDISEVDDDVDDD